MNSEAYRSSLQANTLKVTQAEMDRLASAAAAPFLAAAAAQAQADEFARNAAMVSASNRPSLSTRLNSQLFRAQN